MEWTREKRGTLTCHRGSSGAVAVVVTKLAGDRRWSVDVWRGGKLVADFAVSERLGWSKRLGEMIATEVAR